MSRGKSGAVSKELEAALADEVKEVSRKYGKRDAIPEGKKEGEYVYGTVERMRVYDRALKLESLKLKVDDAGFGVNFGKEGE